MTQGWRVAQYHCAIAQCFHSLVHMIAHPQTMPIRLGKERRSRQLSQLERCAISHQKVLLPAHCLICYTCILVVFQTLQLLVYRSACKQHSRILLELICGVSLHIDLLMICDAYRSKAWIYAHFPTCITLICGGLWGHALLRVFHRGELIRYAQVNYVCGCRIVMNSDSFGTIRSAFCSVIE